MRHLQLVLDMSMAMEDQDLKPSRLYSTLKVRQDKAVILNLWKVINKQMNQWLVDNYVMNLNMK